MTFDKSEYFFPFPTFRPKQDELLKEIYETLENNQQILVSAPTGVGKTISGLGPSLSFAVKNNLKIIYLTSRKTQVNQVLSTIKLINETFSTNFKGTGFTGKTDMCINEKKPKKGGVQEFCDKMVAKEECDFYLNYKGLEGEVPGSLKKAFALNMEEYIEDCKTCGYCPHKLSYNKIKYSNVIIGDYNYFFQNSIKKILFDMGGFDESKVILIVDEAHNLPDRVRSMFSRSLNSQMVENAINEIEEFDRIFRNDGTKERLNQYMRKLQNYLFGTAIEKLKSTNRDNYEEKIRKETLFDLFKPFEYKKAVSEIRRSGSLIEGDVNDDEFESHLMRVGDFLAYWIDKSIEKDSFLRYISYTHKVNSNKEDEYLGSIHIKNLDPSEFIRNATENVFGTVMLSATLEPIDKYKYDLGLLKPNIKILPSPFSPNNVKYLYYNKFSSKLRDRDEAGLNKMTNMILEIKKLQKNTIIFFPSYEYLDLIYKRIYPNLNYGQFIYHIEDRGMTKEQKEDIINSFKLNKEKVQLLFGVSGGNFYEGLDLPGKDLEIVVLAGFPFPAMNLENEALKKYYERKGIQNPLEFTYIFPAISKSVQGGGRCIRTDDDRGLIFMLDTRFFTNKHHLPPHWEFEYNSSFETLSQWLNKD